jgi:hypothetical protein
LILSRAFAWVNSSVYQWEVGAERAGVGFVFSRELPFSVAGDEPGEAGAGAEKLHLRVEKGGKEPTNTEIEPRVTAKEMIEIAEIAGVQRKASADCEAFRLLETQVENVTAGTKSACGSLAGSVGEVLQKWREAYSLQWCLRQVCTHRDPQIDGYACLHACMHACIHTYIERERHRQTDRQNTICKGAKKDTPRSMATVLIPTCLNRKANCTGRG